MTSAPLGSNLRRLRVAAGLSQERLSIMAGHNPHYVGKIKRGALNPSAAALSRLALLLQAEPAEFEGSLPSEPIDNLPRGRPRRTNSDLSAFETRSARSGEEAAPQPRVCSHGNSQEEKST